MNIVNRFGNRPFYDGSNAARIHRDAFGGDDVSEKGDFLDMEFALFEFNVESILEKAFENLTNVLDVFFKCIGEDEDVIEVGDAELIEKVAYSVVGVSLEGARGTGRAKWHNEVFEETVAGTESCFVFIAFGNSDEVKGVAEV